MVISCSVLLRMRNVSEKFAEKIKTHILSSITFFFLENVPFFEMMWKNTVERGRPQMTIWRMRIEYCMTKVAHTHTHTHTHTQNM